MWTTKIEDKEFTLFFDIDQLQDGRISFLSDNGKITWLHERAKMLLIRPVTEAFTVEQDLSLKEQLFISLGCLLHISVKADKSKFRLTEMTDDGQANLVIGMFSILMNGIEALGSFITVPEPRPGQNGRNFKQFLKDYMPMWNFRVSETSLCSPDEMINILWKHFRNGIAHGFIIENGGLNFLADERPQGYFVTTSGYLQVGPRRFIKDFNDGLKRYFQDVRDNVGGKRTLFLTRFNSIYPN